MVSTLLGKTIIDCYSRVVDRAISVVQHLRSEGPTVCSTKVSKTKYNSYRNTGYYSKTNHRHKSNLK